MKTMLKALSPEVLEELRANVEQNLDLYMSGGFAEMSRKNGWEIEVAVELDTGKISALAGVNETSELAVSNSLAVWQALKGLSPNLAAEERIWTRLTHIEGLKYTRERWLNPSQDKEKQIAAIQKHFFARGTPGVRDDNAIGRLWWNSYIAKNAAPDDMEGMLRLILKTTDYRQSFVERSLPNSRGAIAAGGLRALKSDKWLNADALNYRAFQVAQNRLGGGVVFEIQTPAEVDEFMQRCIAAAKQDRLKAASG